MHQSLIQQAQLECYPSAATLLLLVMQHRNTSHRNTSTERLPLLNAVQLPDWHSTNSKPSAATISVTFAGWLFACAIHASEHVWQDCSEQRLKSTGMHAACMGAGQIAHLLKECCEHTRAVISLLQAEVSVGQARIRGVL